jgi:RNA polymerase sigma-70 factor (ECF subfamily)
MSDIEVIKLVLSGERDRYRVLVERYQDMIFRTCLGFVHNKEDADDLSQEVFIQAFQSLPGFKGEASFSTWIFRIAVNASLNKVRKSSRNLLLQRIDNLFGPDRELNLKFPVIDDPETLLINDEHRKWVRSAVDSLPENQRTAIVLSKYDDLSQKQIAEIMNSSEGAVEALIQRAKANLRKKLSLYQKRK